MYILVFVSVNGQKVSIWSQVYGHLVTAFFDTVNQYVKQIQTHLRTYRWEEVQMNINLYTHFHHGHGFICFTVLKKKTKTGCYAFSIKTTKREAKECERLRANRGKRKNINTWHIFQESMESLYQLWKLKPYLSQRAKDTEAIDVQTLTLTELWNKKGKISLRMSYVSLAREAAVGPRFGNICVSACRHR